MHVDHRISLAVPTLLQQVAYRGRHDVGLQLHGSGNTGADLLFGFINEVGDVFPRPRAREILTVGYYTFSSVGSLLLPKTYPSSADGTLLSASQSFKHSAIVYPIAIPTFPCACYEDDDHDNFEKNTINTPHTEIMRVHDKTYLHTYELHRTWGG